MLLRGYTPENTNKNPNYKNQHRKSYNSVDKRYSYNPRYEPIRGSDIFCELPPKYDKYVPEYEIRRKYEIYYNKKQNEENYEKNKNFRNKNKSYNKINKNKVYDINKEKYEYNPYKTTYKSSFIPIKINENILVGNDKMLGTGVAYNSRKQVENKKLNF